MNSATWAVPALALFLAGIGPLAVPAAIAPTTPPLPAHPVRIVALGVPADELTLALVEPSRIAALDRFADDEGASNVTQEAAAIAARVSVSAESIAAVDPDLVLVPAWTGADLDASLHRFDIATLRIDTPTSVDDVRRTVRSVARALDATVRGEALVTAMDASLDGVRARRHGARPTALVDAGSGLSPGAGTLMAELVAIAGGELLFARAGLTGLVPLSLERELSLDPDVLLVDAYRADARSRGIVDATRGAYGLDPRLSVMRVVREGRVRPVPARFMLTTTHHVAETASALFDALHGGPR